MAGSIACAAGSPGMLIAMSPVSRQQQANARASGSAPQVRQRGHDDSRPDMSARQYIGYARPLNCRGFSLMLRTPAVLLSFALAVPGFAFAADPRLDTAIEGILPKVIEWRRDLHRNPELSNREVRTSKTRGRAPAVARTRSAYRDRAHGRGRRPARRPAGAGHRAARRHGRAARDRADRPAVQVGRDTRSFAARKSASCMPAVTTVTRRS